MAAAQTSSPEFVSLWPTVMLRRMIPNADSANEALFRAIRELEHTRRDLTTDYLGADFLSAPDPAVAWLKACINKTVVDYFSHFGTDYPVDWNLQAWANVNRFGDYHDLHNHPHSYLSGTYYVRVPRRQERLRTRKDVRPGCISFYDPRATANMTAIRGDPYIEAEYTVKPEAGMVLLWPAFLNHFVHPNLSKELRVSVSFNVVLHWSDRYLPDQP